MRIKLIDRYSADYKNYRLNLLFPHIKIGYGYDKIDNMRNFQIEFDFNNVLNFIYEKNFVSLTIQIFGIGFSIAYQDGY